MKISYVTSIVKNMGETVKFYKDIMGFSIHSEYVLGDAGRITLMQGPCETMFELIENPQFDAGFYSIGMDVENLDETLKKMRAKGVHVLMDPVLTQVGKMSFIVDPNGVKMALIEHF
ncbi:VOC family protein [Methanolapillus ohkumae]|uniref:VOC domain-containing protein n=1 Tax=Methanolapillus ohkumae TaxID=3028298 RepID=A0AA96V782_9EURY|nr:hypothetical protein MsAm2_06460 [Methanosarcinaceae archaeon Am2]